MLRLPSVWELTRGQSDMSYITQCLSHLRDTTRNVDGQDEMVDWLNVPCSIYMAIQPG